jgi:archaellum component FlaD/FlaE
MNYSYIDNFTDFANDPTPIEELLDESKKEPDTNNKESKKEPDRNIEESTKEPDTNIEESKKEPDTNIEESKKEQPIDGKDTKADADNKMMIIGIVLLVLFIGIPVLIVSLYKIIKYLINKKNE